MKKKSFKSINDAINQNPAYVDIHKSCFDGMQLEEYPPLTIPDPHDPPIMPDLMVDQISNCIQNATDEVNTHTRQIPDSAWRFRTGITLRNTSFIFDMIDFAQRNPETQPPHFNMDRMLKNMSRYNIFIMLFRLVDTLRSALFRAFRIPAVEIWEQFREYYQYNKTLGNWGDNDAQVIYERLTRYWDFNRNRTHININELEEMTLADNEFFSMLEEGNAKIKQYLMREKELKKQLTKDIKQQDKILDSANDKDI